jgi:hypothetical protein
MSVRHEVHAWNSVKIFYNGTMPGLTPQVRIMAIGGIANGKFWDGAAWQVAVQVVDMVEIGAPFPKLYEYDLPEDAYTLGARGYICVIDDDGGGSSPIDTDEYLYITVKKLEADQILGDLLGDEDYTDTIAQVLKKLLCVAGGQWEIDADANQLILYDMADPPAALYTFDLKDADDNATSTAPYKREPA